MGGFLSARPAQGAGVNIGAITRRSRFGKTRGRKTTRTGSSARSASGSQSTRFVTTRTAGSSARATSPVTKRHLLREGGDQRAPHDRPGEERPAPGDRRPGQLAAAAGAGSARADTTGSAGRPRSAGSRAARARPPPRSRGCRSHSVSGSGKSAVFMRASAPACSPGGRCSRRRRRSRRPAPGRPPRRAAGAPARPRARCPST